MLQMGAITEIEQKARKSKGEDKEEEEFRWSMERASQCVEQGDLERAMSLLRRAQHLRPAAHGLQEIMAVTEVCYAASGSSSGSRDCFCSRQSSPHWYNILQVDEKADINAIKRKFRQLALLLHPDKNRHTRAEEAFKLVSEAYAHLCDKNKRAIFDIQLQKQQCKLCSESKPGTISDSARRYREFLKGRSQTNQQRYYFPSKFHTAEWKMQHEKLRMFREGAEAKVDSLAQLLRERRSKWSDEMSMPRENSRTARRNKDSSAFDFFEQGTERKPDHRILRKDGLSLIGKRLLEELKNRKLSENRTDVLKNLDGLLGILREEIGSNWNMKAEDRGVEKNNEGKEGKVKNNRPSEMSGKKKQPECKSWVDKLEEERMVIDAFLANLSDHHLGDNQDQETNVRIVPDLDIGTSKKKDPVDEFSQRGKGTVGDSRRIPNSKKQNIHGWDHLNVPFHTRTTNASTCTSAWQTGVASQSGMDHSAAKHSSVRLKTAFSSFKSSSENKTRISSHKEDSKLQSDSKKSEQVLSMFERLREETKSISATLESMKEHVSSDKMGGIFSGSCHVPAASFIRAM